MTRIDPQVPWSTTALRGLRLVSLVTMLVAVALGLYVNDETLSKDATRMSLSPAVVTLGVAAVIAGLGWALARWRGRDVVADALELSTISLVVLAPSCFIVLGWWQIYWERGQRPDRLNLLIAALVLVGMALGAGALLRMRRRMSGIDPGAANDPARWGRLRPPDAEEQEEASGPGLIRRRDTALRLVMATAVGLLPCLVLAGVHGLATRHLTGPVRTVAGQATTAAPVPDDALPAIPQAAPSTVAWTKDITTSAQALDIAAGARGPLILTHEGIEAINPDNGTTLWTYRAADVDYGGPTLYGDRRARLVVSPDGKHVAVTVETRDPRFSDYAQRMIVVLLDALTGRVVAQVPTETSLSPDELTIQMTDSAALIGPSAYSLADGHRLWTLDAPEDWDPGYSGPAGHSTFILRVNHNLPPRFSLADLILVPDADPAATITLSKAGLDPFMDIPVVVGGWVITYTGNMTNGSRLSAWDGQAVSIDAVAASGSTEVEAIPMGRTSGPNMVASTASGQLVTYPELTALTDLDSADPVDGSAAAALFDPVSRSMTAAGDSSSIGAARAGRVWRRDASGRESTAIRISPANGQAPLEIPVPWTIVSDERSHGPDETDDLSWRDEDFAALVPRYLAAPGCLVVALDTGAERDRTGLRTFRLYGVR